MEHFVQNLPGVSVGVLGSAIAALLTAASGGAADRDRVSATYALGGAAWMAQMGRCAALRADPGRFHGSSAWHLSSHDQRSGASFHREAPQP